MGKAIFNHNIYLINLKMKAKRFGINEYVEDLGDKVAIKIGSKNITALKSDVDSIELKKSMFDAPWPMAQATIVLRIRGTKYAVKKIPKKEAQDLVDNFYKK